MSLSDMMIDRSLCVEDRETSMSHHCGTKIGLSVAIGPLLHWE